MLRGNLAADLVLNRRSRSAATRRFSFEPIRLASLPLADLGCESGSCLVRNLLNAPSIQQVFAIIERVFLRELLCLLFDNFDLGG